MAKEGKKKKGGLKKKAMPNIFEQSAQSEGLNTGKEQENETNIINDVHEINRENQMKFETEVTESAIISFDWNKPVYLQMHRENIYSIFSSAIITPARYSKNRAFPDAQTIDDDFITLANGNVADLDATQVLCELSLTNTERRYGKIHISICYLDIPIPISRVKKIYITDDLTKKDILLTARSADGGIIPEHLIQSSFPKDIQPAELTKKIQNGTVPDYSEKIRQNDKILGAFAFIKNYSWLLASKTNSLTRIPTHVFYMLNAIAEIPELSKYKNERANAFYRQLFGFQTENDRPVLKWIFDRINLERNFNDVDIRDFGEEYLRNFKANGPSHVAIQYLNDLTDSLKRKRAIQEIWNSGEPDKFYLYLFGFLRYFGNASAEDKSISRKDLPEMVAVNIGEYVFASLGYFYGYKLLRNYEDDIKISDKYFSQYFETFEPLPLKFDLSTLLDYYIIEITYQAVFHSVTKLKRLDFPVGVPIQWLPKINFTKDYNIDTEEILGVKNFSIHRKSEDEIFLEQLSTMPDIIPCISEIGVYCFRNNVQRSGLNILDLQRIESMKYFLYFKREHILDAIRNKKIDAGELLQRLAISRRHKEL